ncbi:MAG: hypothetical protein V1701_01895 [Planctomycetota bacterium]
MKLQIRKRLIRYFAVLYLVMGMLGVIMVLLNPVFEEAQLPNWKQILFMIPTIIYLLTGFGLIIFKKWARILSIIVSAIICALSLYSFLPLTNPNILGEKMSQLNLVSILLFTSAIIILLHKDTKLIFERKGNLEGLE